MIAIAAAIPRARASAAIATALRERFPAKKEGRRAVRARRRGVGKDGGTPSREAGRPVRWRAGERADRAPDGEEAEEGKPPTAGRNARAVPARAQAAEAAAKWTDRPPAPSIEPGRIVAAGGSRCAHAGRARPRARPPFRRWPPRRGVRRKMRARGGPWSGRCRRRFPDRREDRPRKRCAEEFAGHRSDRADHKALREKTPEDCSPRCPGGRAGSRSRASAGSRTSRPCCR